MSGAVVDRPALRDALDYGRSGDTLIVWMRRKGIVRLTNSECAPAKQK